MPVLANTIALFVHSATRNLYKFYAINVHPRFILILELCGLFRLKVDPDNREKYQARKILTLSALLRPLLFFKICYEKNIANLV